MVFGVACGSEPPCDVTPREGVAAAWCVGDEPVIVINEAAGCPVEVVRAAAGMWGPLAPSSIEVGEVTAAGHERYGEITISVGDVPDHGDGTESVGRTRRTREQHAIVWARVVVESCDRKVLAHEIGHALGFTHSDDPSELMFPTADHEGIPAALLEAYEAARGRASTTAGTSPRPEAAAPLDTVAPTGPQRPSVAWILIQPYGAACDGGQRASDNVETLFVTHPDTGRCSFKCVGEYGDHTATCEAVDGYCDASGWCRSVDTPE